jgi:DNA-binding transcriptional LysR family regulator
MNLYHLQYFYDSARLNSITKAAQLNRVGQPAISKAIQNLEANFKKKLISHERNRFQLTEDGQVVFSYCEKIFSATDELKDALANQFVPSGIVRFSCPSSMAESPFLSAAIKSIGEKYPSISLKLMLGRTDIIQQWVKDGVVDFGISLDNVDFTGFDTEPLRRGFHFLIKSKNYNGDWQKDGVLTVENKREVIVLRQLYQSINNERLKVKMEIGSWSVIKRFVLCGMAVGYVPDYVIQEELKNKLISIVEPKKLSVPYEIRIIRKADRYLSRCSQLVISEFVNGSECAKSIQKIP